jgi:hypothetical protein
MTPCPRIRVKHFAQPIRSAAHSRTGALGQVDGVEGPLVTRPPTVTVLASPAGIISCHGWAAMRRGVVAASRITERAFCAGLADRLAIQTVAGSLEYLEAVTRLLQGIRNAHRP